MIKKKNQNIDDGLKPSKVTQEFINSLREFITSKGCKITGDQDEDNLVYFQPPEGPITHKECDEWLDSSGIREWIEENGPGDIYVGTDSVEEWVRDPKPDECYCFYAVSEDRHFYPWEEGFVEEEDMELEEIDEETALDYLMGKYNRY